MELLSAAVLPIGLEENTMSKDFQDDVRKSSDIDVQNGESSRQRLYDESSNSSLSDVSNGRMSSNTTDGVLPGMVITDSDGKIHKPENWCGTVDKGEIVHTPGVLHPVDPYVRNAGGELSGDKNADGKSSNKLPVHELTEEEADKLRNRKKDPAQEWVESEKKMYEDARLRDRMNNDLTRNHWTVPDNFSEELNDKGNEIADLINSEGNGTFGEGETRENIKKLFEDAVKDGSIEDLLDYIRIGKGIDFQNLGYQKAIRFDYDPASNEVKMIMQYWPLKMGAKEIDSIKLFS